VFLEPPAIVDGNLPFALGTYFLGHLNPRSLRNPRYRHVIEAQRRIAEEHIKEIWAEQEALNAARPPVRGSCLSLAPGYAGGRPRRARD